MKKTFLITGVANKKSVAYFVSKLLIDNNCEIILSVQSAEIASMVAKLFPTSKIYICDLSKTSEILKLKADLQTTNVKLDGVLHSVAFAKFSEQNAIFHQVPWEDFSDAIRISCFSLIELSNALLDLMNEYSSIVTISISDTKATSYGYLGTIKELLNSSVGYLAKSLASKKIRVNAVGAGPLKTSASSGIPNYIENYLYAEQMTLWHKGLATEEVAQSALFLLGTASSGINGTVLTVDGGMSLNHFDQSLVKKFNS